MAILDSRPTAVVVSLSDLLHIVDIDDLTDGPKGTSKKASINQLIGAIVEGDPVYLASEAANITDAGSGIVISVAERAEIAANTAKITNATHTSEVTGSGALTVAPIAISNKALIAAAGTMELLVNDGGTLKKIVASDLLGGGAASLEDTLAVGNVTGLNDIIVNPTGGLATSTATQKGSQEITFENYLWNGSAITRFWRLTSIASTTVDLDSKFVLQKGGIEQLTMTGSGFFGIQEANPTHTLDVNGTAYINGITQVDGQILINKTTPTSGSYSIDSENTGNNLVGLSTTGTTTYSGYKLATDSGVSVGTFFMKFSSLASATFSRNKTFIDCFESDLVLGGVDGKILFWQGGFAPPTNAGVYANMSPSGLSIGNGETASVNTLDVNGTTLLDGNATVNGDLVVDTDTLFVDASGGLTGTVGLGTVTPTDSLEVRNKRTNGNTALGIYNDSSVDLSYLRIENDTGARLDISSYGSATSGWLTSGQQRADHNIIQTGAHLRINTVENNILFANQASSLILENAGMMEGIRRRWGFGDFTTSNLPQARVHVDGDTWVDGDIFIDGTKVIDAQGAAVADATDAATAITQLNALLARVRVHGLIA